MFNPLCSYIPVMVLLEIHTDCQTSSEVAKECPESHEGLQGKGRRTNKHSVCIHKWLPLGERWQRTKQFFFEPPPSPSPPRYIDGLAFFLVVLLYASMIRMVHK